MNPKITLENKMKKLALITTVLSLTAAFGSNAGSAVQFKPTDASFETKVCYTAAKYGIRAAERLIRSQNYSIGLF